jgi:hypothetical protein
MSCTKLNKTLEVLNKEYSGWDGQPYDELTRMKKDCNEEKAAERKAREAKEAAAEDKEAQETAAVSGVFKRQDASNNFAVAGGKKRGKKTGKKRGKKTGKKRGKKSGKKTRKKRVTRRR